MIKGDLRKASLLKTAEQMFFARGYASTTINDILEVEHCSKGSFYHHFESKLDVLTALCLAHAQQALTRYQAAARDIEDPLEKLNLLLEAAFPVQEAEKELCALLLQLITAPEGEQVLSVLFEELRQCFWAEFYAMLQQLREKELAFFPIQGLPELVFNAYQAQCRQMLRISAGYIKSVPSDNDSVSASDTVKSIRYLMERVLDLPFGSIRIADPAASEKLLK